MAYFPNGESGRQYQAKWCDRCIHWPENPDDGGCHVWLAHLLFNGHEASQNVLNVLIPRDKDGIGNGRCSMFQERL